MLMTADGSDDDKIQVQGLTGPYTFKDADGGSDGGEVEVEEEEGEGRTWTRRRRRARRRHTAAI